jgi:hypothetical protein
MKNIHKFNKIQINKKNIEKNELLKNVLQNVSIILLKGKNCKDFLLLHLTIDDSKMS